MHSKLDYNIPENDRETERMRDRVLSYMKLGEREELRLVEYCRANIPRDRYVPARDMHFAVDGDSTKVGREELCIVYTLKDGHKEAKTVHAHALSQIGEISNLKGSYRPWLNEPSDDDWRRELLAYNLNVLFQKQRFLNRKKQDAKFLHRIVGNQLRAVLTQSYNRHIVSAVVLQPFLEVCRECGLRPTKASITDTRVHLQTYLPYAFQPYPGEFIAIGVCWSNSDFGQGKIRISHNILRLNGLHSMVTEESFSRVHIGSVVEDTDIALDDVVAVKELEAIAAASQSSVRNIVKPEAVTRIVDAISKAAAENIPWTQLKGSLSKIIAKDDVTSIETMLKDGVDELPPAGVGKNGEPLPSRWWVAAALAHVSEKQKDPGKAMAIRAAAGTYLGKESKEA